jgi:hypothetical protein
VSAQLELFASHPDERLFPYWRKRLAAWPCDVFTYRNMRDTTGWSMARQGMCFARWLFKAGQMSRSELRRWWRLERAVLRRDAIL